MAFPETHHDGLTAQWDPYATQRRSSSQAKLSFLDKHKIFLTTLIVVAILSALATAGYLIAKYAVPYDDEVQKTVALFESQESIGGITGGAAFVLGIACLLDNWRCTQLTANTGHTQKVNITGLQKINSKWIVQAVHQTQPTTTDINQTGQWIKLNGNRWEFTPNPGWRIRCTPKHSPMHISAFFLTTPLLSIGMDYYVAADHPHNQLINSWSENSSAP